MVAEPPVESTPVSLSSPAGDCYPRWVVLQARLIGRQLHHAPGCGSGSRPNASITPWRIASRSSSSTRGEMYTRLPTLLTGTRSSRSRETVTPCRTSPRIPAYRVLQGLSADPSDDETVRRVSARRYSGARRYRACSSIYVVAACVGILLGEATPLGRQLVCSMIHTVEHAGVRGTDLRRPSRMVIAHALEDGCVSGLPSPIAQTKILTHRLSAKRLPAVDTCQTITTPRQRTRPRTNCGGGR